MVKRALTAAAVPATLFSLVIVGGKLGKVSEFRGPLQTPSLMCAVWGGESDFPMACIATPTKLKANPRPSQLIAGLHRLRACQSLGWTEIPALVCDLGEQERIIAECDENNCGPNLSAAEVAMFTAKRKAAYLVLHPETGHGKAGANNEDNLSSFDRDQADKTA